jgi:hypothetical protein
MVRNRFDENDPDYARSVGMLIHAIITAALVYTFVSVFLGYATLHIEHKLGLCVYLVLGFFLLVLPKGYKIVAFLGMMMGSLNIIAFTPNFFYWSLGPTQILGRTFHMGIQPFSFFVLFVVMAIYWTATVSPVLYIISNLFTMDHLFDDDKRHNADDNS